MRRWCSFTKILVIFALVPSMALAATHNVSVGNFSFTPKDITVQVGDTIQWNWSAGTHTVANGANPFDAGAGTIFDNPMDSASQVFQWVVTEAPGLLTYHCGPHWFAGMTGTIDIQPGGPTAERHEVVVRDFTFDPFAVSIALGDTVCWTWESGSHTTTSGSSSNIMHNPGALWDSPINVGNQEFCFVFDGSPGLFPYFSGPSESDGMTGVVAVDQATTGLPLEPGALGPVLMAPYPNPSSRTHNMRLVLDVRAPVTLDIYDLQGRNVYSEPERMLPQGDNMLRWVGETKQGTTVGPGMYLVRVQAGSKTLFAKLFRAASSHAHHH